MKKERKKISMQDIADRLNLSKNAVSLALNGKEGVSEETRDLVVKTAQQMNYSGILQRQAGNKKQDDSSMESEGGMQSGSGMQIGNTMQSGSGMQTGNGVQSDGGIQTDNNMRPGNGMQDGNSMQSGSGMHTGSSMQPESGMQTGSSMQPESGMQTGSSIQSGGGMRDGSSMQSGSGVQTDSSMQYDDRIQTGSRMRISSTRSGGRRQGGSHMRTGNKILVILPEYIRQDRYFYHDVYWAVESHARQRELVAVLSSVSEEMQSHNQVPSIFYDMDFIGIIIVGALPVSYVKYLQSLTPHIVSVDQCYHELDIDTVITDHIQGSYRLARYMIDAGHQDIGFVGSMEASSMIYERWCGYQQAMLVAGLPVIKKNWIQSDRDEMMAGLQEMGSLPTAWICGTDRAAMTLIEALHGLGYSVPRDISVAGFENIEAGSFITPPLTTVDVNRNQLGSAAVDLLLQSFQEQPSRTKTSISTSLVIRSSVAQPPR